MRRYLLLRLVEAAHQTSWPSSLVTSLSETLVWRSYRHVSAAPTRRCSQATTQSLGDFACTIPLRASLFRESLRLQAAHRAPPCMGSTILPRGAKPPAFREPRSALIGGLASAAEPTIVMPMVASECLAKQTA